MMQPQVVQSSLPHFLIMKETTSCPVMTQSLGTCLGPMTHGYMVSSLLSISNHKTLMEQTPQLL